MIAAVASRSRTALYEAAWQLERRREYPTVDALEAAVGFALDRDRLESAARVLACPLKASPPNWQHGRVLYALTRRYLAADPGAHVQLLDIGTAKGFSALCLEWARRDAGVAGQVTSVDVIDPRAPAIRNTAADPDGRLTLAELLAPWAETQAIAFVCTSGVDWLQAGVDAGGRVHVAFVDGKHDEAIVGRELALLAACQAPGDLVIVDDVQIRGVAHAVEATRGYDVDRLALETGRMYGLGIRRC